MVEADLQDAGVDVGDTALMRARTWRWLRVRLVGLLTKPPVLDADGRPHFTTRIQSALLTPAPPSRPDESHG